MQETGRRIQEIDRGIRLNKSTCRPTEPRTARALWQAIFWVSCPFGILAFVLPIYGKELGATALEVGGFFSAMSLVPVIVRPFLGRVLDRWGRRPFLLLGLLGYSMATVLGFWLVISIFRSGKI